jgi:aspartate aminotransferase-like enzyme
MKLRLFNHCYEVPGAMSYLTKRRLFTPGPTPLLAEAYFDGFLNPMHHRKEEFKNLFINTQKALQQVFKTQNDMLLLSCSGSGAMEAAVTNLLMPGDQAIIGVAGKFGERWVEMAQTFGVEAKVIQVPYGESVDPREIGAALDHMPQALAVFVQASETSTGAAIDLEGLGHIVSRHKKAALVVDAITGIGTMPIETDAWGLDIVIGGSQKAFMAPPGVAMMSVSEKAWAIIDSCKRPRYYFDLAGERKKQKEGQSAFTPAVSVIQALNVSLAYILKNGIDNLVANAVLQAGVMRAALASWSMAVFPKHPGNAVTAFLTPEGVDPAKVIAIMRDRFDAHIIGGQGSMKGKILRISHLGYFDFLETLGMIGCLEFALQEAGARIQLGSGVTAALEYYRQATRSKD